MSKIRRILFSVAMLQIAIVGAQLAATHPTISAVRAIGALGLVALATGWSIGYRRGRFSATSEVAEAAVLVAVIASLQTPERSLGLLYAGLIFRSMYGSWRVAAVRAGLYLGVCIAGTFLCSSATLDSLGTSVLLQIPGFTQGAFTAHALATLIDRHELNRRRDDVLAAARARLVRAPDPAAIYRTAFDAARSLVPRSAWPLICITDETMSVVAARGDGARDALGTKITLGADGAVEEWLDTGGSSFAPLSRRDGHPRTCIVSPMRIADEPRGALVFVGDIEHTEFIADALRVLAIAVSLALENASLTEVLRRSEARFRALVHKASDVVTVIDATGVILYETPAVRSVLGYRPEDRIGTNGVDSLHPDDRVRAASVLSGIVTSPGRSSAIEVRVQHADGSWRWLEAVITNMLDDPAVGGLVANYREITERKALEAQLTHQAFHDALTGLANRALFEDRVRHALARAHRTDAGAIVMLVDLDDFKAVNDTLGHAAGDTLLKLVADRIRGCLRETDTLSRLGGDEFAILLEQGWTAPEASLVADRVLRALREPVRIEGRDVFVRASIGIAAADAHGSSTTADLLRDADLAMYTAKANGKGSFAVYQPAMHTRLRDRIELEHDLRAALELGQLDLRFQPIVRLEDEEIVGIEALARWQHPSRGLLAPAEFITVAEDTGQIVPLGRWVLEGACAEAAAWQRRFPNDPALSISVNVSARQIIHPSLVSDVHAALERSGLPPSCLTLEITESLMVYDDEHTAACLRRLRNLGVRIAIDDFGAGISSLVYLQRLPVDVLKIDPAFVERLSGDRPAAVARAIIELARTLRLDPVAEGVETAAQAQTLRDLGCTFAQGTYFCAPVPAGEIEHLLRDAPRARRARMRAVAG